MVEAQPELLPAVWDDIVPPPLPQIAERAWEAFGELNETRDAGSGGISRIKYVEMLAYQTMTGVWLSPLDVALVKEADKAFAAVVMEQLKDASGSPSAPTSE
jgi:hypothetical protein